MFLFKLEIIKNIELKGNKALTNEMTLNIRFHMDEILESWNNKLYIISKKINSFK